MRHSILVCAVFLGLIAAASADPIPNEMVCVPAGVFIMGDGHVGCGDDEREVTLTRSFYLGQHEVTNQEYLEALQWAYEHGFVTADTSWVWDNLDGSTKELLQMSDEDSEIQFDGTETFYLRESPSSRALNAYPDGYDPSDHPIKEVTWHGSARYCDWLSLRTGLSRAYEHTGDWACNGGDPYGAEGYRLPTDAEWEYAAQWDDERIYPWGDQEPDCSRANYGPVWPDYCVRWTTSVGSYLDAPEALGLSDMAGNLWEWCDDWFVCYLGTAPVTDPTAPGGGDNERVLRGGAYSFFELYVRCSYRNFSYPEFAYNDYGFRAARTATLEAISPHESDQSQLILESNTPNPFTSLTQIRYSIPSSNAAAVNIYDATGRMIRTLRDTSHGAGVHSVTWDGKNVSGEDVPGGVCISTSCAGPDCVRRCGCCWCDKGARQAELRPQYRCIRSAKHSICCHSGLSLIHDQS
ncbi:SUMF1/EgtB/PvdO family nonheme iron enzyme [Candidatus Eisenbacteria bacterium]|uniref:SUMF1/EgtB/PvdO family nonheme iron enzyme n=1 Tax=Eiseniibacteriota bacterium TaxID=2212470 RepID=A0ABV6YJD1_UNCEI